MWAVNTIMLYLGPNEGTEPKKVKTLIIRAQVTVQCNLPNHTFDTFKCVMLSMIKYVLKVSLQSSSCH